MYCYVSPYVIIKLLKNKLALNINKIRTLFVLNIDLSQIYDACIYIDHKSLINSNKDFNGSFNL